ncbi:MAG: hypothetical protein Q9Q13_03445 [Acidobacteriota bacterium]|nr:hypothetical protein [Acidobacteriota bacterium]
MRPRSLLILSLPLLFTAGPALADREHHHRFRRPPAVRVEVEAGGLVVAARRLRVAVEHAWRPPSRFEHAALVGAAEDFERHTRRLYRATRRRGLDRREVAERFLRVERSWHRLSSRLRHYRPGRRVTRAAALAGEAVWHLERRVDPCRVSRARPCRPGAPTREDRLFAREGRFERAVRPEF